LKCPLSDFAKTSKDNNLYHKVTPKARKGRKGSKKLNFLDLREGIVSNIAFVFNSN
jgi:hypothetical protein